ncbi:MAG TPA: choice-of-anchor K domain-containing protein [Opitutus sp.]|nr:choice-of-anchor K domain-containing protein [Opitutus sp.]
MAASALGLVAALPAARAQLLLSGHTHAQFTDPGAANTTVTNGADSSMFSSGIPYSSSATQTSVGFTGTTFAGAGNGDTINLGTVDLTNGITLLGSTASAADFNILLNLPELGITNYVVSQIHVGIDNTSNNGMHNVPDLFQVTPTTSGPLVLGHTNVNFNVSLSNPAFSTDGGATVGEGSSANFDVFASIMTLSPVPEPSTYALWGAALLVGVIAIRRFRTRERMA